MKYAFKKIKTYISPFLNWRILIIYLPIWFIMSGWTYLFIFLGTKHHIPWMLASGSVWATILWLPITPEKLITIPLTLLIYVRWRGGKGDAVSNELQNMLNEARGDWQRTKTRIVAIYRKTKAWFSKNYNKIIKTFIVLLGTTLLMMILGLILMG